jgi:cytidylate kinase
MLKLSIDAQLPIVAAHTRDTLNLADVLKEITKKAVTPWAPNTPIAKGQLYLYLHQKGVELQLMQIYKIMVEKESTLLVINSPKVDEPMFDAGEIPVPRSLMMSFMKAVVGNDAKAAELLRGLGGCTIKEAAELARLTMARDNSLTVGGLMETRKSSFQGSHGLTQVDVKQSFYSPMEELFDWVGKEKKFFLTGTDPRLIPRGLLLAGPPGTGKTAGAKWVAQQMGVPLYRVDVGGTKSKWMGESEGNLLANLARLDFEAPAVCVLDEVEKVFSSNNMDTTGTTTTMLSQLLWWLAERRARVLVLMTTNDQTALPRELYREGRIDKIMWFDGLIASEAADFVSEVLKTFPKVKADSGSVAKILLGAFPKLGAPPPNGSSMTAPRVSQAKLTEAVYAFVKASLT